MSLIGNLLWIVLAGGIFIFAEYLVAALALTVTIIGIPFALQCLKLAVLSLAPFGKTVVSSRSAAGCSSSALNLIWMLTGGLILALTHLFFALACTLTIVGLPFARQHMKLCSVALAPFGREIVSGQATPSPS